MGYDAPFKLLNNFQHEGSRDNHVTVATGVFYWSNFGDDSTTYIITITEPINGTISVKNNGVEVVSGTKLAVGSVLTLLATANEGYVFGAWQDGNANASRTLILTKDTTILATFNQESFIVTLNNKTPLAVYPNPVTNGQLTIESGKLKVENVEIFDMTGKRVHVAKPNFQLSTFNFQLTTDISHLPSGIYFVKVGNNSTKIVKK
jgi:hypothetical protein